MTILQEILKWIEDKPIFWLEAVYRLIQNKELTEDDIEELYNLLFSSFTSDKNNTKHCSIDDLRKAVDSIEISDDIVITEISDTKNINALMDDGSITFEKRGLTVVYGDNGSGKSSYVGILKNTCNTRGTTPKINHNLFLNGSQNKDQTALVHYSSNEKDDAVKFKNGLIDNQALKAIDVFDSSSANHYIEGEDEIAYMPSSLTLIEKLAKTCQEIEGLINDNISELNKEKFDTDFLLTDFNTPSQLFLTNLNKDTKHEDIEAHCNFSEEDLKKVEGLEKRLIRITQKEPSTIIKQNKIYHQRFSQLKKKLVFIKETLNEEFIKDVVDGIKNYKIAKETVEATSKKLFSNLSIDGIGSETWKHLWESARSFYNEFEENHFPNTEKDALCPLCLQSLDNSARERFKNFEDFIKQDAEKKFKKTQNELKELFESLDEVSFEFSDYETSIEELNEIDGRFQNSIDAFIKDYKKLFRQLKINLKSNENQTNLIIPKIKVCPVKIIEEVNTAIENENKDLLNKPVSENKEKIELDIDNLKTRKQLAKYKKKIKNEIEREKRVFILKKCAKKCNTRGITTFSNELSSKYIGQALKDSFISELKKLGFKYHDISLETKGKKGKQYNFLRLNIANGSTFNLKEILSEGEHRCISLATFFSELSISEHNSAIIFDDPVSSLDHKWRNKIAKRISKEASVRQVIVFTHDITFLLMLQETIKSSNISISSLTRKRIETGISADNPPWDALNVSKRIGKLKAKFQQLEKIYRTETEEKYTLHTKTYYGKLRETWERMVEEVVLNGVVQRFGRSIQTNRLKKAIDISKADYETIESNMTICSIYFNGHDTAGELIEESPEPSEVKKDLETMISFRDEIIKRRK